jgi:hypothetical protein
LEFAGKNLLQKASARPDLVSDLLRKVRRDGLMSAVQLLEVDADAFLGAFPMHRPAE